MNTIGDRFEKKLGFALAYDPELLGSVRLKARATPVERHLDELPKKAAATP